MATTCVYKDESKRPLTKYQKRVNGAAIELCLQNPGLLPQENIYWKLLDLRLLRKAISLLKANHDRRKMETQMMMCQPTPKCRKYSKQMRDERVQIIKQESCDLADRIRFKKERIKCCENMRDYKKCDELKVIEGFKTRCSTPMPSSGSLSPAFQLSCGRSNVVSPSLSSPG